MAQREFMIMSVGNLATVGKRIFRHDLSPPTSSLRVEIPWRTVKKALNSILTPVLPDAVIGPPVEEAAAVLTVGETVFSFDFDDGRFHDLHVATLTHFVDEPDHGHAVFGFEEAVVIINDVFLDRPGVFLPLRRVRQLRSALNFAASYGEVLEFFLTPRLRSLLIFPGPPQALGAENRTFSISSISRSSSVAISAGISLDLGAHALEFLVLARLELLHLQLRDGIASRRDIDLEIFHCHLGVLHLKLGGLDSSLILDDLVPDVGLFHRDSGQFLVNGFDLLIVMLDAEELLDFW